MWDPLVPAQHLNTTLAFVWEVTIKLIWVEIHEAGNGEEIEPHRYKTGRTISAKEEALMPSSASKPLNHDSKTRHLPLPQAYNNMLY